MPDQDKITITHEGEIIRGNGQVSDLDVQQSGGHATGRSDHSRQPKAAQPARAPRSAKPKMDLEAMRKRSGAKNTAEAVNSLTHGDAEKTPAAKEAPAAPPVQEEPKVAPQTQAAAQEEETPVMYDEQGNPYMATDAAKDGDKIRSDALSTMFGNARLYFMRSDVELLRSMPPEEYSDADLAVLKYAEQLEAAERAEAEKKAKADAEKKAKAEAEKKAKAEAERKAREAAEKKAREEVDARKAREEAERKAKEEAARKAREAAEQKAREEAERKTQEEAQRRAQDAQASRTAQGESTQTSTSGTVVAPHEMNLDLGNVGGSTLGTPAPMGSATAQAWAQQFGPASIESTPLTRVSYADLCATFEWTPAQLSSHLSRAGANAPVYNELFCYYVASIQGDYAYLVGYGANIAFVRVRGNVPSDCNVNFGIDSVCAWVNGLTSVVRRTDL